MKFSVTKTQHAFSAMAHFVSKAQLFALLLLLPALFIQGTASAQAGKAVKGRVFGAKSEPVNGASVIIRGTTRGVTTGPDGSFTLQNVPANAVLVVSSLGYDIREVRVGTSASFDVQLTELSKDLDQVVVVGYGTQRKRDVTGSVASISATTLSEVPSANVINELKGRLAGVDIVSNGATRLRI